MLKANEGLDKFRRDKDGRTEYDKECNFYYADNDKGVEYLIAHATIKEVGDDWILTDQWPHKQTRGDFFPGVKPGGRWNISYNGQNPWTDIKSAVKQ
jgi:hypothetical protein